MEKYDINGFILFWFSYLHVNLKDLLYGNFIKNISGAKAYPELMI